MAEGGADGGPEAREAVDFYSFVELAKHRLYHEYGFEHRGATEVLLTLNRVSDIVTYDMAAAVHRPRGRSWSGFRLLFVTWLAGPLEQKRAAELTGMSKAAVSNLAKTLIADGMLERSPSASDGRAVELRLTEAGRAEMVEVFREQNEREQAWVGALTEAEQQILVLLLDKLVAGGRAIGARERT
ncbi:MarR family winged helix-turn-helix transcriptional regulator [Nocardiopsis coralliicola]